MQNAAAMDKPRLVPAWSLNIARLRAAPAAVRANCPVCGHNIEVDLNAVAAKHGELFSFWNRHPPCPVRLEGGRRCAGRLNFQAQRLDSGMWPTFLRSDYPGEWDQAQAAWRAEREAMRRRDRLWRFLRKRQLHRRRVREEAERILHTPATALQETVDILLSRKAEDLDFWVEVRLEVVRRLEHLRTLELDEDFEAPQRVGSL